jgi:D-xylose transport system permease protein
MKTKISLRDFSLLLSLIGIWAFFAFASPQYLSARNLSALSVELAITATLALGMLLVILPGHIDLSVGSGVGLVGGLASVLVIRFGWPALAAFVPAVGAALLIWFAQGTLIVRQRIPAFIVTLGG